MDNLHDTIITQIIPRLNTEKYDIYTNPGQEKNAGIGDNYPDVILTLKGEKTVRFIMEVETEDSVTLVEAANQWKKYVTEINATFYLVVPASALSRAKMLCQQNGINARFTTYTIENNNIYFQFD